MIGVSRLSLPEAYADAEFSAVQDVDEAVVYVNLTKAGKSVQCTRTRQCVRCRQEWARAIEQAREREGEAEPH